MCQGRVNHFVKKLSELLLARIGEIALLTLKENSYDMTRDDFESSEIKRV